MESKSKYFLEKNFIIYLTGKIASVGFSFASIPLFIKYFGIADFGRFSLLYTTFLMFLSGTTGWINQGVLRFHSMERDREAFSSEILFLTVKSAIFSNILLAGVFWYNNTNLSTIILAVLAFFFACLFGVYTTELQARFKSRIVILSDILRLSCYFFIPLLIHFIKPDVLPEIAIFTGILVSFFVSFLMINDWKLPVLNRSLNRAPKWSRKIWEYGSPMSIWMFLAPTLNTSDRYLISFFLGSAVLGQYSALYDVIFKLFPQLTGPFYNIIHPMLINSHNKGDVQEFNKIMKRSSVYLMVMFIGLFLIIYLFKSFIINNYLGFSKEDTAKLEETVVPLLLGSFFWQISFLMQKRLEIANKTRFMALAMFISVSIGLLVSIYFVPKFGYLASAYSTLFSGLIYIGIITRFKFREWIQWVN